MFLKAIATAVTVGIIAGLVYCIRKGCGRGDINIYEVYLCPDGKYREKVSDDETVGEQTNPDTAGQ